MIYESRRLNKSLIDKDLEDRTLQEKSFWCKVLDRIMNIILTLATCNLSFRGHREVIGDSGKNGNFLSIVELLAVYDPVLKELITKPENSIRYLSPKIQKEIIDLLSGTVEEEIVKNIQEVPFFSIITDTTQDIAKIDQMSQIFRYAQIINDENGKPVDVKITESFLGFEKVNDQTASGLESKIVDGLEKKKIELSKCRGQGYDGAATMSGIYNGVQKKILDREEKAIFVHCAEHRLNIVLNDASMGAIPEVQKFWDTIEQIYAFFANSIKRWELLSTFLSNNSSLKLKRLCPTRWSSRNYSLQAIGFRYCDILKALSKIILISNSKSERNEATQLHKEMENFEFVFQVVLHRKVLTTTNLVTKALQKPDVDLSQANVLLEQAYQELREF